MTKLNEILVLCLVLIASQQADAKQPRDCKAKAAFIRANPCPSTGNAKPHYKCPGYIVDHIKALKNGGEDKPENMQWQTIEQAKEKDKWE